MAGSIKVSRGDTAHQHVVPAAVPQTKAAPQRAQVLRPGVLSSVISTGTFISFHIFGCGSKRHAQ
jgi:hypothetical protein